MVKSQVCVWVDPLDGTREFTKGRFQYVATLVRGPAGV